MERRELLSLGGIAAIAGAFAATTDVSAQEAPSGAGKRVIRIYADADGNSQIQELPIATKSGRINMAKTTPVTGLTYAEYPSSAVEDWHRAPGRQFSISLSGEIEVEVSGGKKHTIHAGDIVFLEDQQGKGHITRILTPVTNLFIRVADGFDVVAWSRGEA
jgi:quercetin dioxygenase-like cupin family protein